METTSLVEKLDKLPASLQKEVEDFMDFLIFKNENHEKQDSNTKSVDCFNYEKERFSADLNKSDQAYLQKDKLKREFGGLKGFVKYMADDFDAPLEDFKDYM